MNTLELHALIEFYIVDILLTSFNVRHDNDFQNMEFFVFRNLISFHFRFHVSLLSEPSTLTFELANYEFHAPKVWNESNKRKKSSRVHFNALTKTDFSLSTFFCKDDRWAFSYWDAHSWTVTECVLYEILVSMERIFKFFRLTENEYECCNCDRYIKYLNRHQMLESTYVFECELKLFILLFARSICREFPNNWSYFLI